MPLRDSDMIQQGRGVARNRHQCPLAKASPVERIERYGVNHIVASDLSSFWLFLVVFSRFLFAF
jgi:hypothetical protein